MVSTVRETHSKEICIPNRMTLYWLPVVVCAGIIFYLSVTSDGNVTGSTNSRSQIDKAGHCIAYGALAWLSYRAMCYASIPCTARHATVLAIALASLFGGFCEFIQLYLPWRTASMLDLLANVVGAASAVTLQSYLGKTPQR